MPEPDDRSAACYEIDVGVRLRGRSRHAFTGFEVLDGEAGSRLVGPVADQAALFGVLGRLRDLGIPLVAVRRVPEDNPPSP